MRPVRRAKARAEQGRNIKLIGLWLVIVGIGGGVGAAAWTMVNRPPDAFSLCESGSNIAASSIMLVDATDALTAIQKRRVKAAVETERDRLPYGGKLTIVTVNGADASQPIEVVSSCNPGKASDNNPLFTTASKVEKRWTDAFNGPVELAIAKASDGAVGANSALIATIAALLTRPDFDARTPVRRLTIVSDMLEHVRGGYSHLAGGNFWKGYVNSPLPRLAPLDLRGVSVAIDYLVRLQFAAVQGAAHRRFWRRLFGESGAKEVTFIGLAPPDADEDTEAAAPDKPPRHKPKSKG